MHARELVELSALAAAQAPAFIRSGPPPAERSVQQYWLASKCRFDRWARAIKAYQAASSSPVGHAPPYPSYPWPKIRPVLEEILVSEVLTRVWTAVVAAQDRRPLRSAEQVEPIVRSVYLGHLEARARALHLLVDGRGFTVEDAVALDHVRRRSERWTDLLLGRIMIEHDVSRLAFDAERIADFAAGLKKSRSLLGEPFAEQAALASLRRTFRHGLSPAAANADLNRRIAASVLSCLGAHLGGFARLPSSLWTERLCAAAADTEAMIEELILMDEPVAAPLQPGGAGAGA